MKKINKEHSLKKWGKVLEKLGVNDLGKKTWMAEYAEFHDSHNKMNESTAISTLGNLTGMGPVVGPQPSSIPGDVGTGTTAPGASFGNGGVAGSGDYGQQLLPISMKIAAQTIGLDLVAVKPTPGPVIDLMFIDYRYDDGATNSDDYNPIIFKLGSADADTTVLMNEFAADLRVLMGQLGVRETVGGLSQRMFFNLAENDLATGITVNSAATTRAKGSIGTGLTDVLTEPTGTKEGVIEFLGFSRIDKKPMFRSYRTTNLTNQGIFVFDRTKNSFGETEVVKDAFEQANASDKILDANTIGFTGVSGTDGTVNVELISALEDQIHGFSSAGRNEAMPRERDEAEYAGIIAPKMSTKRVAVGTIKVASELELTELEDIKSQTGIDIVQKMESVLVNELSQTISKQIVNRLFEKGAENRESAPGFNPSVVDGGVTSFDFDVDTYMSTNAPGGETSLSVQRKLITKLKKASGFIAREGRIGGAQWVVVSSSMAAVLTEGAANTVAPVNYSVAEGQLYPAGTVLGMQIYVDPYMLDNDNRILLGRKNNPEQPGVIFVPYLMAQSIQLVNPATYGTQMLLRSRYAITELGHYPQKQYMLINVKDTNNVLG